MLDWSDYIFGVDGFEKSGMRIGDNAILMRTVLAGVFFNLIYLISLSFLILRLITSVVPVRYFSSMLSYFMVIGFGELGFTSFSQPGVVFLIFLPIILIHVQQANFNTNSKSSCRLK